MHGSSPAAEIARSPAAWERIAKDWLVELIERAPLADVEGLPLGWMAQEAPPLIAEILGQLSDPGSARNLELPSMARERAAALASERSQASGVDRLPRDLAALQAVLIEALGREARSADQAAFTQAVGRLAEVFGAVQSAVLESVVATRTAGAKPDPQTGLPGMADLHEWLRILIDRHGQSGAPLAIAHLEIEGIDRIASGYGREAADGMMSAVAGIVSGRLASADRVFRISDDGFVILAPGSDAEGLSATISAIAEMVDRSQGDRGPRVSVAAGIAPLPGPETTPGDLLSAGEEAAWTARAEGRIWAVAAQGTLQDL